MLWTRIMDVILTLIAHDGDTINSPKRTDLSCQEYLEYYQGYNNCTDRKDWG